MIYAWKGYTDVYLTPQIQRLQSYDWEEMNISFPREARWVHVTSTNSKEEHSNKS